MITRTILSNIANIV